MFDKDTYRKYLYAYGKSESSIATYMGVANRFEKWLKRKEIGLAQVKRYDIQKYIHHLQKRELLAHSIQLVVHALTHLFDFCFEAGITKKENPLRGIHIRGAKREKTYAMKNSIELEELWLAYKENKHTYPRNTLMLSLFIFQGLATEDLIRITKDDLHLNDQKVYVRGSRRSNERMMDLNAIQVSLFDEYLLKCYPKLLAKKERETDLLFLSAGKGVNLHNSIQLLRKEVQKMNPEIKSFKHIRYCVISQWTRLYHLRKVQYLAGHKYISSTLRYSMRAFDILCEEIALYHPLSLREKY